ncbi:MAG: type III-B CRISPR module RAMP protein Cmr6 [Cyanobacteriota bacterium]
MPEIIIVKYDRTCLKEKGFGFFIVSYEDKIKYRIKDGIFFHISHFEKILNNEKYNLENEMELKVEIIFDENKKKYSTKKIIEIINVIENNNQPQNNTPLVQKKIYDDILVSYDKENNSHIFKILEPWFKKKIKEININYKNLFEKFSNEIKYGLFEEEFKLRVKISEENNKYKVALIEKIEIEKKQEFYVSNDIINYLKNKNIIKVHNNKFVRKNNKYNPYIILNKFSDGESEGGKKKIILQNFTEIFNNCTEDIFTDISERQKKIVGNFCYKNLDMTTTWRLAIGLGSESVYETGITLHHIYGIPYIPSTSLKGSVRSYTINTYFNSNEEEALKCNIFTTIFGDEDHQGNIIFFDAFPKNKPTLEVDIMNNHYQPYYNNAELPFDYHAPNPLSFLTVKNTEFSFYIANNSIFEAKSKSSISCSKCSLLKDANIKNMTSFLDITKELLKKALQDGGIGAKTSSGYGYMM